MVFSDISVSIIACFSENRKGIGKEMLSARQKNGDSRGYCSPHAQPTERATQREIAYSQKEYDPKKTPTEIPQYKKRALCQR